MHTNKLYVPLISILALAVLLAPSAAWSEDAKAGLWGPQDGDPAHTSCTLDGIWYGGGPDAKYVMTVIPNPGGDYTTIGFGAFTQASLGYPVTTAFPGITIKGHGKKWEFFGTGMVNTSDKFPAPNPELWAVHGTGTLIENCILKLDYDFFGAYYVPTVVPFDKKPFIDPPDYSLIPPVFSETYQKMPVKCPLCPKQ